MADLRHHGGTPMTSPAVSLPAPSDRARAARLAVNLLFLANGFTASSILPRLPAIKDGLGLSNAELGAAVAAMPIGGLVAGGFVGLLIARFGSGRLAIAAGLLDTVVLAILGLSGSWLALAATYFLLGMFDATLDASMNSHGIGVERQFRRSVFQGFHGMWSAGCMLAGAAGAVAAGANVPVSVHLVLASLVTAGLVIAAAPRVLAREIADAHPEDDVAGHEPISLRSLPWMLRILVPIAMLGILCTILQNAAAAWGAIFLADILGQPAGIAALGFVVYMAAMTVARMTNDRWIDRLGKTTVVRLGALIGAGGVGLIMASAPLASPLVAFMGFALIGLGSSPMFPVMSVTAGTVPGIPAGYGVALVSWLVRFGLVVAPAVIGWAADQTGLALALLFPVAASLAVAVLASPLTGAKLALQAHRDPVAAPAAE